jgi:hypothetical protein
MDQDYYLRRTNQHGFECCIAQSASEMGQNQKAPLTIARPLRPGADITPQVATTAMLLQKLRRL